MKKRILPLLVALALAGATAPVQAAQLASVPVCSVSFSICSNFVLSTTGTPNQYSLAVTYTASVGNAGYLTDVGLYTNGEYFTPFGFVSAAGSGAGETWGNGMNQQGDCGGINGGTPSPGTWLVCADADPPPTGTHHNGIAPGETVTLVFTSTQNLATHLSDIEYRSHIQGYGTQSCSIKMDNNSVDGIAGASAATGAACGGGSSVPEPITMSLLGTGLLGLGVIGRRRRA